MTDKNTENQPQISRSSAPASTLSHILHKVQQESSDSATALGNILHKVQEGMHIGDLHVGQHKGEHRVPVQQQFPFLNIVRNRYHNQPEFIQAVEEVAHSLAPLFHDSDVSLAEFYKRSFLALTEPERIISFRVQWVNDKGHLVINRGWRVEFCSALGPYKGGLRFHPTVNEGLLKFLGFEQIFKNTLTGLAIGGGKGGSDFNPKHHSVAEIRRFCQAFMTQLSRYIHPNTDVPAGDIGVGSREIGYMYGQYKLLTNTHGGGAVLTGKSATSLDGSALRPEATGYGLVYIAEHAIKKQLNGRTLKGARCAISGSGNVAQYTAQKLIDLGAFVVSMSDSDGTLVFEHSENGMNMEDLQTILKAKQKDPRTRLWELEKNLVASASHGSVRYVPNVSPWTYPDIEFEFAFPCATQNELNDDAMQLILKKDMDIRGIFEGANMPLTPAAQAIIRRNSKTIIYLPGKAANAGGVIVSEFEMAQNSARIHWSAANIDEQLKQVMINIYEQMEEYSTIEKYGGGTLEDGANRAAFVKVSAAMKELGWIY